MDIKRHVQYIPINSRRKCNVYDQSQVIFRYQSDISSKFNGIKTGEVVLLWN